MKPNDKVVCVDDSVQPWDHEFDFPNGVTVKGEVYCVEAFHPVGSIFYGFRIPHKHGAGIRIVGKPIIHRKSGQVWMDLASKYRLVSEVGHPPIEAQQPLTT